MSSVVNTLADGGQAPFVKRWRSRAYSTLQLIGLITVYNSPFDVKLILIQRFVRVFAFGLVSLLLAAYLAALGNNETQIGIFFGLTLVGDLVIVMVLTQIADVVGRKLILTLGAVSMTISGIVFALSDSYWVLLTAAIVGVISPSATEVGPFKSIEESALYDLVTTDLVDVLSWYTTAEFSSIAAGLAISGAIMEFLQHARGWEFVPACRFIFGLYAVIGILKIILSSCMSARIEASPHGEGEYCSPFSQTPAGMLGSEREPLLRSQLLKLSDVVLSRPKREDGPRYSVLTRLYNTIQHSLLNSVFALGREDKIMLLKVILLMGVDACAVGMSSVPWQVYYVRTRFHVPDGKLGVIFFLGNTLGALGTISSSSIARRLGNLVTVAATYLPAATFIACFGAPTTLHAMLVIIAFASFFEPIYIAPRNAFLRHVLDKEKRTASMGTINMFKIISNATGSFLTGFWADRKLYWLAFVVAGCLKIAYIIGILFTFLATDRRMEWDSRQKAVPSASTAANETDEDHRLQSSDAAPLHEP